MTRNLRSVVCAGAGIHSHNLGTDRAVRNELFIQYPFVAFVNFCSKVFVFPDFRVGFGGPRRLDHTLLASQIELCQLDQIQNMHKTLRNREPGQLDQLFFDGSVSLEACRVVRKEESGDLHRPARLGGMARHEVGQLGQLFFDLSGAFEDSTRFDPTFRGVRFTPSLVEVGEPVSDGVSKLGNMSLQLVPCCQRCRCGCRLN